MEHALIANNHLIAELSSSIRINTDNKQLFKRNLFVKHILDIFAKIAYQKAISQNVMNQKQI